MSEWATRMNLDSTFRNRVLAITDRLHMEGAHPDTLSLLEAVLGGADFNDGFWYGADCWSVIKPSADTPTPTEPCAEQEIEILSPASSRKADATHVRLCAECGGRKRVVEIDSDYQQVIEPCPLCGTGKREEK